MVRRLGDTVPILAVRAPDATQASGVVERMRYTGGKTASLAETPTDKSERKRNDGDAAVKWTAATLATLLLSSSGLKRKRNSDASSNPAEVVYHHHAAATDVVIPLRPESADAAPPNRNSRRLQTDANSSVHVEYPAPAEPRFVHAQSTNAIAGSSRHANALMPPPLPPAHVIFLDICPAVLALKTVAMAWTQLPGPLVQTANYTSFSNNTLHDKGAMKSKAFNRIIQVWLENTDFVVHYGVDTDFRVAHGQGILFTKYNAVTHPSEPNYVAAMDRDSSECTMTSAMYHIPSNISTIVDLLEAKQVSWERRSRRTCPQIRFTAQVGFGLFLAFSVSLYRSFSYAAPNHGDPSAAEEEENAWVAARWNGSISNAFDFVAKKTGCSDVHLNPGQVPQSNLTGVVAGALSMSFHLASDTSTNSKLT
ncbi:hypothetical protein C8R44DRAFT_869228 [Mycena epipterygia]|nr:hypothetical protein C8R44DRAFT_869228 [Mycena epipterygia]